MSALRLSNGTLVAITATGSAIGMPCGAVIPGEPHNTDEYRATALSLGYGGDTLAMCRDHDPLHAMLCDWLGLPESYALREAAGLPTDPRLAQMEEAAVIAVQRFMRRAGGRLPNAC